MDTLTANTIRLWWRVLLQAIAEQNPRFVIGAKNPAQRERLTNQAKAFCESDRFYRLCELTDFPASRKDFPELANQALTAINLSKGKLGKMRDSEEIDEVDEIEGTLCFETF